MRWRPRRLYGPDRPLILGGGLRALASLGCIDPPNDALINDLFFAVCNPNVRGTVLSLKSHRVDATVIMILMQPQRIRAMTVMTSEFGQPRGGLSARPAGGPDSPGRAVPREP